LANQIQKLRRFADALGWEGLQAHAHLLEGRPRQVVRWYEAGDVSGERTHCALQINEHPIGSTEQYSAAVYCLRFRICSGWHVFGCTCSSQALAEADRLRTWLDRAWLMSIERRRAYRLAHPECSNYTWQKLREVGEPHKLP
jgi:hypothetical protein